MDSIFLINITKLVVATELLLQKEILKSDLIHVQQILKAFVCEVEQLYPPNIMLSGMHELLHIVDWTISFGPMNFVNCFQFEEINRKIVSLINGFDLVGVEFMMNFSILQSLKMFCESCTSNPKFNKFIVKRNIVKTSNKKRVKNKECVLKGLTSITDDQFRIVSENLNVDGIDRSAMKSCEKIEVSWGFVYNNGKKK